MGEILSVSGPSVMDPRSSDFADRFGAHLMASGALDELAVRRAQRAQKQSSERFDLVLTRLGLLPEAHLTKALAGFLGLTVAMPSDFPMASVHADRLQLPFLKSHHVLPLADESDRLVLAVADPFDTEAVAAVSFLFEQPVTCCLATASDIDTAIDRLYGNNSAGAIALTVGDADGGDVSDDDVRRLADLASEAPVIRLVQELIARAAEIQASDIHIEPSELSLRVRYRIDGLLHTVENLPPSLKAAVTSRIKIMAHLNIAERRLPQDGRIQATVRGRDIDIRISTMPTLHGESVVMRLLDRSSVDLDYKTLGFSGPKLNAFEQLLAQPNGIVLVTGPTGSGKTTTLYTALTTLNQPHAKIFTVEDPIEYQLQGINQIQVQPRIGLNFASTLRSILRQDPDIMMVGEIRDIETAEIAIQAALTGHLVLSTVHTNSAAGTIARLLDMGVADYLLASTVKGVLAQRLVRKLCDHCARTVSRSPALSKPQPAVGAQSAVGPTLLSQAGGQPRAAVGCPKCRETGYAGRTMISELLLMSDGVKDAIGAGAKERDIEAAARRNGMVTLYDDGLAKVRAGETSIEEVLRVTRMT
ncbi:MAG: type II secretion system ATPase GspE [Hyphomicrobium sp.]